MTIKETTKVMYVTDDGEEFETKEWAEEHEAQQVLCKHLDAIGDHMFATGYDAQDILGLLCTRFERRLVHQWFDACDALENITENE